jgi:hypothetical protein
MNVRKVCGTQEKVADTYKILVAKPKVKGHLGEVDVDGRVM